jgi:tetratricopeptide (TPR) repeat protein
MAEITPFFAVEAEELFENEQYDEAIDLCRRGIAEYPKYPTAYGVLAQALLFMGDENEARTTVENGLSQNPGNKFLKNIIDNFFTTAEMPETLIDSDEDTSDEVSPDELPDAESGETPQPEEEVEDELPEQDEDILPGNREEPIEQDDSEIIDSEESSEEMLPAEGDSEETDELYAENSGENISEETPIEAVEPILEQSSDDEAVNYDSEDTGSEDEEIQASRPDDETELLSGIMEEGGHEEFDYDEKEIFEDEPADDIEEQKGTEVDNTSEENLEIDNTEEDMRKPKPQKGEQMSLQFIIDNSRNKKFRNYSVRSDDFSIMPWVEPQKNITRYRTQNPLASRKFSVSEPVFDFTEAETAKIENDIETKANVITETIANILVKQGAYRQAIEAFNKLVEKHPDRADKFLEKINELESYAK